MNEYGLAVLRSGGSVMTTGERTENFIMCAWTDDEGKMHRESFHVSTLYACTPIPMVSNLQPTTETS